jgi:hypothetical protein
MEPFEIDLDTLQLPLSGDQALKRRGRRPAAAANYFPKGPISLAWLAMAAKLPGKALHVGMLLWFLKGLRRSSVVSLTSSWLNTFGVQRVSAYRALQALEGAGLVAVLRQRGKAPVVTLVVPSDHP